MANMHRVTIAEASPEFPRHDAPTIVELKDGRLLLAWMEHTGGKLIGHDQAPCNIASKISEDGGMTWKDRRILVENDPRDANIHFPNFLRLQNGEILFYYQRRHKLAPGTQQHSTSFVCKSTDEGKTFSKPKEHDVIRQNIISGDRPVQLSSGRIILPMMKVLGNWGSGMHCICSTSYSDDHGESWKAANNWVDLPLRGAMEPRVAELKDGRLLMTMRTQLGSVFKSESMDQGLSWSLPQTTGLISPESQPQLKRIPTTGDLVLVWNHGVYEPGFTGWGRRSPLTVAVSVDDGRSWTKFKNIETDPNFEFTNPCCHFTSQNKIIISYVASRMDKTEFPGVFGRSHMPQKAVIADIDWLYQDDAAATP
jgi:sialidase-1